MNNKVSFDFDDTLSNIKVQKYAKELSNDYEIWVVTNRYDDTQLHLHKSIISKQIGKPEHEVNNDDLYKVTKKLNIPDNHIHFCNKEGKDGYFKDHDNFIFHLDDDKEEIDNIQKYTDVPVVDVTKSNWKERCNKLLK